MMFISSKSPTHDLRRVRRHFNGHGFDDSHPTQIKSGFFFWSAALGCVFVYVPQKCSVASTNETSEERSARRSLSRQTEFLISAEAVEQWEKKRKESSSFLHWRNSYSRTTSRQKRSETERNGTAKIETEEKCAEYCANLR